MRFSNLSPGHVRGCLLPVGGRARHGRLIAPTVPGYDPVPQYQNDQPEVEPRARDLENPLPPMHDMRTELRRSGSNQPPVA
jgi:hypothetical protein